MERGPELIFLPCAGFGNRLRAIASALVAAEAAGRSIRIIWTRQHNIFVAPFREIFKSQGLPSWVTIEDVEFNAEPYWARAKLVRNEAEWLAMAGEPVLKSYYAFYKEGSERWLQMLRRFQVSEHIETLKFLAINHLQLRRPMVGVHIRRTDNRACIEKSPSELFWKKMAQYSEDTMFYVASDSQEEKYEIFKRFPGRVVMGVEELIGRNSIFGCIDSVLEFYILSQSSEILGSYKSSFSEVAAAYGGAKLVPMIKDN